MKTKSVTNKQKIIHGFPLSFFPVLKGNLHLTDALGNKTKKILKYLHISTFGK